MGVRGVQYVSAAQGWKGGVSVCYHSLHSSGLGMKIKVNNLNENVYTVVENNAMLFMVHKHVSGFHSGSQEEDFLTTTGLVAL